jgi:hypothetical protein
MPHPLVLSTGMCQHPTGNRNPARADVVVLAIDGSEQTSREAWARNHLGDGASLDLVGRQDEPIDAIAAIGRPKPGESRRALLPGHPACGQDGN